MIAYRFVAVGVFAGDRRAEALVYRPPPPPGASIVKTRPRGSLQVGIKKVWRNY